MKERYLSVMLVMCLTFGMLPVTAMAAEHSHDEAWKAVTMGETYIKIDEEQQDSNTLSDGSYYLGGGITVPLTVSGEVKLCLHGNSITVSGASAVTVSSGASLTLSDCGSGLFGPNNTLSRAMLAQILYNNEGRPAVSGRSVFADVAEDAWYADAVIWASANGIVGGYGNGEFGPGDPITREQLVVMLYRYAQRKGGGFTGMWMFQLDFADASAVSEYAYEAMCWCNMNGVVNGYGDKTLRPKNTATRAQAAQMLKNFMENT